MFGLLAAAPGFAVMYALGAVFLIGLHALGKDQGEPQITQP